MLHEVRVVERVTRITPQRIENIKVEATSAFPALVHFNSFTMASNDKTILAFDLYGTLLSTESIGKELAKHFGDEKAQSIAALWRR